MTFSHWFVAVGLATPGQLRESQLHMDLFVSKVPAGLKCPVQCEAKWTFFILFFVCQTCCQQTDQPVKVQHNGDIMIPNVTLAAL